MWTSLRDVVARAGSFDDVLPHLKPGTGVEGPHPRIMARAPEFYNSKGRPWKGAPADGRIPADWWAQLCSVDPAANRATFRVVVFSMAGPGPHDKVESFTDDILAIGVELESAAAEALWPAKSPVPHAGGRDPDHNWEGAACYVDQHVADHGPLRRHKTGENAGEPIYQHAVDLILGWFENQRGPMPPPIERTVQKWVRNNPERCRHWWG